MNTDENKVPTQVCIPIIVVIISISSVGTFTILAIGIVLGLFFGIKHRQKKLKKTKQSISATDGTVSRSMQGPIYEELDLEDETATIDLSKNIAYAQVKKTES